MWPTSSPPSVWPASSAPGMADPQDRGKTLITGLCERGSNRGAMSVSERGAYRRPEQGGPSGGCRRVRSSPAHSGASPAAARGLPRPRRWGAPGRHGNRGRGQLPDRGLDPLRRCPAALAPPGRGRGSPAGWRSASSSGQCVWAYCVAVALQAGVILAAAAVTYEAVWGAGGALVSASAGRSPLPASRPPPSPSSRSSWCRSRPWSCCCTRSPAAAALPVAAPARVGHSREVR